MIDLQIEINKKHINKRNCVLAFFTGVIFSLSFAPAEFYFVAYICPIVFFYLISFSSPKCSFRIALSMALGLYIGGASWLYHSVFDFGVPSVPVAVFFTGIGLFLLSVIWALPWLLWTKFLNNCNNAYAIPGFIAFWLVGELSRTYIAGGYPWFFLGYAVTDLQLAQWGQLFGVHWVSLIILFQAFSILIVFTQNVSFYSLVALSTAFFITIVTPYFVPKLSDYQKINIAVVQSNIGQREQVQMNHAQRLSKIIRVGRAHKDSDLLIYSEGTIPRAVRSYSDPQLRLLGDNLVTKNNNSVLVGGIYREADGRVTNSVFNISGGDVHRYNKQKLVAFGEFIPFSDVLGKFLDLFNMPHSNIEHLPGDSFFTVKGLQILPLICFEIAFPAMVARGAKDSNFIVNMSNDSWFGDSQGPLQHFQITKFRAIETGKPIIRATTTGVTAIIDGDGKVLERLPQFTAGVLNVALSSKTGSSLYSRTGNTAVYIIIALFLVSNLYFRIKFRHHI